MVGDDDAAGTINVQSCKSSAASSGRRGAENQKVSNVGLKKEGGEKKAEGS
jgi:hypothetical protein